MDKSLKAKMKTILFAVVLIVLMSAIQVGIGVFGGIAISVGSLQMGESFDEQRFVPLILLFAEIACVLIFGIWYFNKYVKRDKDEGVYESGLKKILNVKDLSFITTLTLAGFFLANIIYEFVSTVIPGSGEELESLLNPILGSGDIFGIIAAVILAPIAEELVFRGLLVKNSKKVFGLAGCMVLSGVAFGIMHFNPVQSIYAIPIGMIFAYFAYKYNSVIPAILGHMINNFIAAFLPVVYQEEMGYITCTVLCLAFFAIAVAVKKYFLKNELAISQG